LRETHFKYVSPFPLLREAFSKITYTISNNNN
jgi:hypothetical protein